VRRGAIVRVVVIALLAAAVATAVALFIPWLPPQRSKEGERIDFVLWFTVAICIGVFAVVAAISVYSVAKFRVRPDDDSDGPPIHGHTGIEIAWTAIPTILVTTIAVVSAVALAENGKLKDDRVVVEVTARQFAWTFAYPTEAEAAAAAKDEQICKLPPETANCPVSGTLRLPEGRQVELRLRALDVIHSFWVPEFRQKQDAVPGIVTHVAITPTEPGEDTVVCTELCGLGHALMRAGVIVMREGEFDRWRSQQEQELRRKQG
jgi:cytochrome c oxidase subunit II